MKKKRVLNLLLAVVLVLAILPMSALAENPVSVQNSGIPAEQYNLAPGGTYYFDLSGQGIPGSVNSQLPDASLKWVPFTYVGTVNAYRETADAATNLVNVDHSLFMSDYATHWESWNNLNAKSFVIGKNYQSRGVDYTFRMPSGGLEEGVNGANTAGNEWDAILDKNDQSIKNWGGAWNWTQQQHAQADALGNPRKVVRGNSSARQSAASRVTDTDKVFRPVLEITSTPGATELKTVTFDMDGSGTLGDKTLSIATVVYTGQLTLPTITAENGFKPVGSTAGVKWSDGINAYEPGTTVTLAPGAILKPLASVEPAPDEEFSLAPGGTYYFDLAGAADLPGTVNNELPDSSLKWVPFTYVGTVKAYNMMSNSDPSPYGSTSPETVNRSLFIANYNVVHTVEWNQLNNNGYIFGTDYASRGVAYKLRAPSVGTKMGINGADPAGNEWDQILNKNMNYIKNFSPIYTLGQELSKQPGLEGPTLRVVRGGSGGRDWNRTQADIPADVVGYRPVLEVLNPATLGTNGLKTVTYWMGGEGTLGNSSFGTATVIYTDKLTLPAITAENGYKVTTTGTGTLVWQDTASQKLYVPGTEADLPTGTTLKAIYATAPTLTGQNALQVGEGYVMQAVRGFTTTGTESISVTKISGDDKIAWSENERTLFISIGLPGGVYPVTLRASNGVSPDATFTFTLTVLAPPHISGPTESALVEGYAETGIDSFTITGTPVPTVTKVSGDDHITWNDSTKKLEIAAGLVAGDYPVTLKASNGVSPDATHNLIVKVNTHPTIAGPTELTLVEGYTATSAGAYSVTGTPVPTVTKVSGDGNITWNDSEKKLDIAAGLAAGSYPVALKASNGVSPDATLTFTLTVNPDPDIAIVAAAKTAAEGASYNSMTQVAATSESVIVTALKATAEAAVNNSNIAVTIDKVSYTAPVAGDADNPSGTDGSYTFTVTLAKGSQSQTTGQKTITITATAFNGVTNAQAIEAAKAALVDGAVDVAFGASQADKTAAVQAYVNSKLIGDAAGVTANVAYNSGTGQYDVALSKGSASDSKSLAMTVNESADPDIAIVAAAKTTAEGASYSSMTQAAATGESVIVAALKAAAETAVSNSSIAVMINKVSYTAPVAGDADNPSGTDGNYTFTITVAKGSQSQTTGQKTITITATNLSNNANLSDLHVSRGRLNETFDPATTGYTQSVGYSVSSLAVTPQAADPTSTVQVNHVRVPSGQASGPISLHVGNNRITIVVTAEDQTSKTYTIDVTRKDYVSPSNPYYPVTDVSLDIPELALTAGGETAALHATVRPSYATYTSVTWSSSDPKVATVDSEGVVTPLSPGTATITVTTTDQAKTATSKVKVVETAKLIRLKASEKAVWLQPNKSASIAVYAIYSNGTEEDITEDRAVKYSTSSKTKATVTAGVIKAGKKEGTATITITYLGQRVKIPVRISKLRVTNVKLQPSTLEVAVGQEKKLQLKATLSNKKTEDVTKLATWSSSDPTVATIDENGKLTAIAPGTSVIIAKYSGKTSKMTVEVSEAKQVKRLTVSKRNVKVSVGKEQSVKLTAYFKDNSKEIVTKQASWSSEDEMIVSVKNGVISGKAAGTVDIQATYQGKTATITVTVTK